MIRRIICTISVGSILLGLTLLAAPAYSAEPNPAASSLLDSLAARSIGPVNMGGRIIDIDVVERDPKTIYFGAATGGVWKTVDAGKSWQSIFDHAGSLCIGAVAVSQANPNIVWVGTGEQYVIRSTSCGDGVYKSSDGGKSWQHMGLKDSQHIGQIVIHPTNPDIVYVAAMGHGWGKNAERGLYKTTDGGKTWRRSMHISDQTGVVDVALDPSDPNILYAAAYTMRRDPFCGMAPRVQWSQESGLFQSTDGGTTWKKLTNGLPDRPIGRIGLAVYPKNPNIVYAILQTDKTPGFGGGGKGFGGKGLKKDEEKSGDKKKDEKASDKKDEKTAGKTPKATPEGGGVFRSDDKGKTWTFVNPICPLPFTYCQIRVDPNDDQRLYVLGIQLAASKDGGKTFTTVPTKGVHVDHKSLWINPNDSKHLILGNDGGLYFSTDQGTSWQPNRGFAIGQFYALGVDMSRPFKVYGGLQDNGVWGGPSSTSKPEGITMADWTNVMGADGFYTQVDPEDPDTLYCEIQSGGLRRVSLKAPKDAKGGAGKSIKPIPPKGEPAYRFNWNSPLMISPHHAKTIYFGGNFLFKSTDRGDTWQTVSPDLTYGDVKGDTGHTLTTIAESPLVQGLLYVGTDDGRLHVSRDAGKNWAELTIAGVPKDSWFTRVECSRFAAGTAYVTIDRHRSDDLKPYVFKTTDYGATWISLVGNLPGRGGVHVIRESPRNKDLLFAGTEWGLFGSVDGGQYWQHLKNGIPAQVCVHDLVVHPRDPTLVIGTHGRSIYVMDIAAVESAGANVVQEEARRRVVFPALRRIVGRMRLGGLPD